MVENRLNLLPLHQQRLLATDPPASHLAPLSYVSLRHAGTLTVEGDEFRLVVRYPEGLWSVQRLEQDRLSANFQGNPLWPELTLAPYPNLSAFFGLDGSSNEEACILPLPSLIQKRLRSLFVERGDKVFYFVEAADWTDCRYVDAFLDHGQLPYARLHDRDSIHDWSYHFVTLLFPDYLENLRLNLRFIRDHLDRFQGQTSYAWNYYGHSLDANHRFESHPRIEAMPHVDAIYRQMAISLDVFTAKIVQLLNMRRHGLLDKCQRELDAIATIFNGVSLKAVEAILWMETDVKDRFTFSPNEYDKIAPMAHLLSALERLEQECASRLDLKKDLRRREILRQTLEKIVNVKLTENEHFVS